MTKKILTGAEAAAEAMRQINPDVVAAYPITPQTPIVETFARVYSDGIVDTEMIRVESEHSAMSACVGASAAGARVMTATSSVGLALMWEVLGVPTGMRLPIVMNVANRALSGPINIHCDHSDSMGARDLGWIQLYSENAQEVYENNLIAMKLAEKVKIPAMVMQDGFITTAAVQNVETWSDKKVKKFIGTYKPYRPLLDFKNPPTYGPLALTDSYFEIKEQQEDAIQEAKKEYLKIAKTFKKGYFEEYKTKDADFIVICLNSTAGTAKVVVDKLRKKGKKVGLIKPILFRPFSYEEFGKALKKAKKIAVLDRSESFGAMPPLFSEIKLSAPEKNIQSYVYGLGGREIFEKDIEKVFSDLQTKKVDNKKRYLGLRT